MTRIQRVVVLGAGAVGASTAAELALHGHDHLLIGRGKQIRHIAEHGLRYIRPEGAKTLRLNTVEGIAGAQLRPGDLIITTVKTQHVEESSQELAWLELENDAGLAADLPILTIQNGLAAEPILARRHRRIYSGSILIPASYTVTGEVTCSAAPQRAALAVGKYLGGVDETLEEIAEILRGIGWQVQTAEHVIGFKALKLLSSVRDRLSLFDIEAEREQLLGEALVTEAAAVLEAAGIPIARSEDRTVDFSQFQVDESTGYSSTRHSTWQSLQRGGDSEVDWLNGEIVQLGRLHGVATPANAALQRSLGLAWRQGAEPGTIAFPEIP